MNQSITKTDKKETLKQWQDVLTLSRLPSDIGVITFDVKGKTNTLTFQVLNCLTEAIETVKSSDNLKALVFYSEKPDIFITGADIREISKFESEVEAKALSESGHSLLKAILDVPVPTIAAIDGICLGGGLELALCCDYRIATDEDSTVLGLPELTIGLIPGLGGTQRLPRLVGYRKAVDMILSSEAIPGEKALEFGIIDKIVSSKRLLEEAQELGLKLANEKFDKAALRLKREESALEKDGGEKKQKSAIKMAQRVVKMRGGEHYPAPPLAIEAMKVGLEEGIEKGLEFEIESFTKLSCGQISKNLISLYFSKEMASQSAIRAMKKFNSPENIAIIGSGFMGAGIAELACLSNLNVMLKGSSPEKSQKAIDNLDEKLDKKHLEHDLTAVSDLEQLAKADLVIETITENLEKKRQVFEELNNCLKDDCLVVTNTSSIPIEELAGFYKNPDKVMGMHFFAPVNLMPLVEMVSHDKTSKDTINKATAFVGKLNKVPVSVKDSPGFVVNRLLNTYIIEAIRMAGHGVPVNWIEDVAKNFGMPLGPFELLDELGWNLAISVSQLLGNKFGKRLAIPDNANLAEAHNLNGKSTNLGAYIWQDNSKKQGYNPDFPDKYVNGKLSEDKPSESDVKHIENVLFLTMIDEASRCLEEKVVRKARDIDLALITGAGFPAFRGGLLRYADKLGIEDVINTLKGINSNYKSDRDVSNLLNDMHNIGRKFYSLN